ncbi:MAG: M1 family metallopeptidase [Acidobacteria bacterium]|nr:M1 family metallopeptidase [Acidobacteriota bacterium]
MSSFRRTALVSLAFLLCLIDVEALQVQQSDQPVPGARSPRNANYDIDVTLDHAARRLTGRETIRWRNISANPTAELQFHLYWNAWRDQESTWLRERRLAGTFTRPRADAWGSIDVTRLRVRSGARAARVGEAGAADGDWSDLTGATRFIAPDDGNAADRTVMAAPLPVAVQPNETVEIEVEWTAKIPRPFARTGYVGNYYFIAHWFPKLGVLEDAGWNTHQFHAATEFYADYGVYDVRIEVPQGFVIGASGRQVERTDVEGGGTRHRYRAEDVHDFAWTTSPDFVEVRQTFTHASLPAVEMRLLLQPEHRGQEERHFSATAAALRYYGEWFGPYPYNHVTIVDPAFQSGSGGMEYPTLFTAGTRWIVPARGPQPGRVTVHEAGHQFWYGARVAGRGAQYVLGGARDGSRAPSEPGGVAVLRRIHSMDDPRHSARPRNGRQPAARLSRQRGSGRAVDADVPVLAGDGHLHHLQQDRALAAHARAATRMAGAAASDVDVFRSVEVPPSAAGGFLRGRQ